MNFSKYVTLTPHEFRLVVAADSEYDNKPQSRRTRLYSVCRNRRDNDIEFIKVAVRHVRGERCVKPVAVTSVDSRMTVYSGECNIISSYGPAPVILKVGWSEIDLKPNGLQKDYAAYGRMWWYDRTSAQRAWLTHDLKDGRDETRYWLWWSAPLNFDETIAANPRFRYCAYAGGTTALEWLRRYSVAPEIENFAKLGIPSLATIPFVRKLRKDKGLFRYLRTNLDAIKDARWCVGVAAICHAYNHGLTIDAELGYRNRMRRIRSFKRELNGYTKDGLPRDFDYQAAVDYIDRANVSTWEYRRYLDYCIEGGADLTAPQTAFPRDIERRLKAFDEADAIRRKREARARKRRESAERREREASLRELAEAYMKACSRIKATGYALVFPSSAKDFVREGNAMDNCIGGGNYTIRHADRQCVCVFIRLADAPEKPFVDVEIVKGKVVQCYTAHNQTPDAKVRKVADRVAKAIFRKAA